MSDGDLHESILLYQSYCLQALNRLNEAESILKNALAQDMQGLRADFFYRLGAVYLQKQNFAAAIDAFKNAERYVTQGRISLSDICMALSETYKESGDLDSAEQYRHRAKSQNFIQ